MKKRLVIFGVGDLTRILFSESKLKKNYSICFFVDSNKSKQGKIFYGKKIYAPDILEYQIFDKIFVVMGANKSIESALEQLDSMKIDRKKVILGIGFSNRHYCETSFDLFFEIEKFPPLKAFSYDIAKKTSFLGETNKSRNRRIREHFFEKYCTGKGLDICNGGDLITDNVCSWEIENGDAQYLTGVKNESFDYVYCSHGLEHMNKVRVALKNWFRVVKKGGYLIVAIPHRDLYEKKKALPSRWNTDHRHMFLIGKEEAPDTLDISKEIKIALKNFDYDVKYIKTCDEGFSIYDPLIHSNGEYQIEFVIRRK